jgi:hypothetical protein
MPDVDCEAWPGKRKPRVWDGSSFLTLGLRYRY